MRTLALNMTGALTAHEFVSSESLVVITNLLLAVVTIAAMHKEGKENRVFLLDVLRTLFGRTTDGPHSHRKSKGGHE